jgi:thiol-disulfide isomerase/thioredoxin
MDRAAPVLSMGVTGGLIALAAALLVATVFGVALRRRAGRFRSGSPGTPAKPGRAGPETQTRETQIRETLTEADLGTSLGKQATLVQFSTAFCAPCRPTRQILAQVADMVDGVTHVDIDAAARLDLVRRLRISSTPTILVLDPDGAVVRRAVGLPRKADVIAALGSVVPGPGPDGAPSDSRT